MPTTVLIPTDLTVASLNTLKLMLQSARHPKVDVVLVYAMASSWSIQDLLFYSPYRLLTSLRSREFNEALAILQNTYASTICNLRVELFHGVTLGAFKAFVEGARIDEIYIAEKYSFTQTTSSIDLLPFIHKCKLPVFRVAWPASSVTPDGASLGALFNNPPRSDES